MATKLVLFFNQANHGWTETYYSVTSEPSAFTFKQFDPLWKAAIQFRAPPTLLYAMRASDTTNPSRSALKYLSANFQIDPPGQFGPGTVSNDAQIALFGGITAKRFLSLRGLYDESIQRSQAGIDEPTAPLLKSIDAYVKQMIAFNLCIQYVVAPPNAGLLFSPIVAVQPGANPSSQALLTLSAALGNPLAVGQIIRFAGIPKDDLPGFPISAQIISIAAGPPVQVTIGYSVRNQGVVHPTRMRLTQLIYGYAPITFSQFVRFSERKTGRPFGALRGASRAVIRRH